MLPARSSSVSKLRDSEPNCGELCDAIRHTDLVSHGPVRCRFGTGEIGFDGIGPVRVGTLQRRLDTGSIGEIRPIDPNPRDSAQDHA